MFERRKITRPYEGRIDPFRIIGNVYFVGTFQSSVHLIDTGDGLILIDTGYSNALYLVIHSIYKLGYRPEDIKYIINTHWHWDHTEGSAALAELSGAKNVIGRYDYEKAKKYVTADIQVKDGDELTLGNTTIRFLETPGHTRGTVSVFFDTVDAGKTYRVGMFGGAGANTLVPGQYDYDGCVDGYLASLDRLKGERVDVFIGNHTWNNDTFNKAAILRTTGENRFIDGELWCRFLDFCRSRAESCRDKYGKQ